RTVVDPVHLPTTTPSDPEVSNWLVREPWSILFTYLLQHPAIQRSAIGSSENRGRSCSLTRYNTQRSRCQQLARPRTVVDPVKLLATTPSDPDVSNWLAPEP